MPGLHQARFGGSLSWLDQVMSGQMVGLFFLAVGLALDDGRGGNADDSGVEEG